MTRIPLDLTPQHYRSGRRGNPWACLLEKAAEDQYGIKLRVGGASARERRLFFPRTWTLDGDARQIVALFDSRAPQRNIFRGRRTVRVHLTGPPLQAARDPAARSGSRGRRRRQRSSPLRTTAGIAGVASGLLILDGLAWVVIAAASLAVAILAAVAGARVKAARGREQSPGGQLRTDHVSPRLTRPEGVQPRASGLDFASGWDAGPEPEQELRQHPRPWPEQATWKDDPEPGWPAGPEPPQPAPGPQWPHAPATTSGTAPRQLRVPEGG